MGNRFGSVVLSGTTLIDGNTIVRCGNIQSGWDFTNGALWFYALDADMTGNITVRNTEILESPYAAVMLITTGKAKTISNVHLENITIDHAGTFVLEIKASAGSLTAKDVSVASLPGFHGVYDCGAAFALGDRGGNGGWLQVRFPFKMLNFALNTMDVVFKTTSFPFKMIIL